MIHVFYFSRIVKFHCRGAAIHKGNMVDCLGEAKTSYRYAAPGQFSLIMYCVH